MLSNTNKKVLAILMVSFICLGFSFQNGYASGKPKTKKAVTKKTVVKKTPSKDEIDAQKLITEYLKTLYNLEFADMEYNDNYFKYTDKRIADFKKYFNLNSTSSKGYNNFICSRVFSMHDTAIRNGKFNISYVSASFEKNDEDKNYFNYSYKCKLKIQFIENKEVTYINEEGSLSLVKKSNKWFIDAVDYPIINSFFKKYSNIY